MPKKSWPGKGEEPGQPAKGEKDEQTLVGGEVTSVVHVYIILFMQKICHILSYLILSAKLVS
jgi:hypothetical protein